MNENQKKKSQKISLFDLPVELWTAIWINLPRADAFRLRSVSKRFNQILSSFGGKSLQRFKNHTLRQPVRQYTIKKNIMSNWKDVSMAICGNRLAYMDGYFVLMDLVTQEEKRYDVGFGVKFEIILTEEIAGAVDHETGKFFWVKDELEFVKLPDGVLQLMACGSVIAVHVDHSKPHGVLWLYDTRTRKGRYVKALFDTIYVSPYYGFLAFVGQWEESIKYEHYDLDGELIGRGGINVVVDDFEIFKAGDRYVFELDGKRELIGLDGVKKDVTGKKCWNDIVCVGEISKEFYMNDRWNVMLLREGGILVQDFEGEID